jgi:hypothetical protein
MSALVFAELPAHEVRHPEVRVEFQRFGERFFGLLHLLVLHLRVLLRARGFVEELRVVEPRRRVLRVRVEQALDGLGGGLVQPLLFLLERLFHRGEVRGAAPAELLAATARARGVCVEGHLGSL